MSHTQTNPRKERTILLHTIQCDKSADDIHERGNYVVGVQHVKGTTQKDKMIIEW
jgi:hypothetical protein